MVSLVLDFNPRAPYGARRYTVKSKREEVNFNPRAPYGARLIFSGSLAQLKDISIHAPHTGRDISYTPPLDWAAQFQSTRPIRGATRWRRYPNTAQQHFNPRAPYGARLAIARIRWWVVPISIHAPHTGRDYRFLIFFAYLILFQSTRPIRGATRRGRR